jgi:hypothetical protein
MKNVVFWGVRTTRRNIPEDAILQLIQLPASHCAYVRNRACTLPVRHLVAKTEAASRTAVISAQSVPLYHCTTVPHSGSSPFLNEAQFSLVLKDVGSDLRHNSALTVRQARTSELYCKLHYSG